MSRPNVVSVESEIRNPSRKSARSGANRGQPPPFTRDQSYCDVGYHQNCSGYTEDESDPETCLCGCHTEETP